MKFILKDIGKRKFGVTEPPISANDLYLLVDDSAGSVLVDYNELLNLPTLNIEDWDTAFSWGNHAEVGYLTEETDPIFTASPASGITGINISNWSTAYGWGDHSTMGYLTEFSESDPIFTTSPAYGITSGNITNWNTAFSWGDHSTMGYLTSVDVGVMSVTGTLVDNTDPENPVINSPYIPTNVSEFNNDAGYITEDDLPSPGVTEISVQNTLGVEQFKITDTVQFGGVVFDALNKRITPSGGDAGYHEHDTAEITSGVFPYERLPISLSQVTNWELAFAWGDHSTMGYLTNVPLFNRITNGLVPMPGGTGITRYLREDGTWASPAAGNTYGNMLLAELNTGTSTTGRIISAKTLNDWINGKGYVTDSGVESVTGIGVDNTDPKNPIINIPTPYTLTLSDLDTVYGYRAANQQDLNNLAKDTKFGRGIFLNNVLADFSDVPTKMGTYTYAVARNVNGGFIWVQRNAILNPIRFHIYGRLFSEDAENTSYNNTSEVAFSFNGSDGLFLSSTHEIGESVYKYYSSAGKTWSFDSNTPDLEFDFWVNFLGYEDEGSDGDYEPYLGLPTSNGQILSSTTSGDRIWIDPPIINDGVESVTGDLVDNTDPKNPIINSPNTGVMSVTGALVDNTDPDNPTINIPNYPIESVTGDLVDNTDPKNPIINSPALPEEVDQDNIVRVLKINYNELSSFDEAGVVEYLNVQGITISEKEIWVIEILEEYSITITSPIDNQIFDTDSTITITSTIV